MARKRVKVVRKTDEKVADVVPVVKTTPSRKKQRVRETEPIHDGHATDVSIVSKELSKHAFNTVIRNIKNRDVVIVDSLRTTFFEVMRDLGVKRDREKAVQGIPNGSDSLEKGSVVKWAKSLTVKDKKAIGQLVAIHATLMQRVGR